MTCLKYIGENILEVNNNGRVATITLAQFYARTPDQDLHECVAHAVECAGELVAVPSVSRARGLRPRNAQVYGVSQL